MGAAYPELVRAQPLIEATLRQEETQFRKTLDKGLKLLDEATAQVDGITEAAIQTVLRAQARRGAVVTVAHRLSTVLDADEIVVMDSSRVVARGTHAELLGSSALYRDLVEALRIRTDVAPVG